MSSSNSANEHPRLLCTNLSTMKPLTSSSLPVPNNNKKVRFDENLRVVEFNRISSEKNHEDCTASDDSNNETNAAVTQSVLSRNIEKPSVLAKVPPGLFHFSNTDPPVRPSPMDHLVSMHSHQLVHPVELFPLSQPAWGRGCMEIINSALECVESLESSEIE